MERKNDQRVTSNGPHPFSSSGIFSSMVAYQSPLVFGRESLRYKVSGKTVKDTLDSINGSKDGISRIQESESHNTKVKIMSSIYQEQIIEPCNLCSSIYYGGQDIFHYAQSTQNTRSTSLPKDDGKNDDSGAASRGDWWKGGLYY